MPSLPNIPSLELEHFIAAEATGELYIEGAGLIYLNNAQYGKVERILGIPESATILEFIDLEKLEQLPNRLPNKLTVINCCDCENLTYIPELLPESLTTIRLGGSKNLKHLPDKLPDKLHTLFLADCEQLEDLPELPQSIKILDLSGCIGLRNNPELIRKLEELEEHECRVTWPEHLDRDLKSDNAKEHIATAYKEYYKSNPYFKDKIPTPYKAEYPTLTLFHRFLNESRAERGGVEVIANTALSVAESIAQNPETLEAIDKESKIYIDACVNQPVAGFTVIANLMEIAKQPDIPSKMQAARALLAIELVKEKIKIIENPSESKVGEEVEAELCNAMLREVHRKLLSENIIQEPWPGIPDGVAYRDSIKDFLTEKNINSICAIIKDDCLSAPLNIIENFLCERHLQNFWAHMTLTKEEYQELSQKEQITKLENKYLDEAEESSEQEKKLSEEIDAARKKGEAAVLARSKEITSNFVKQIEDRSNTPGEMQVPKNSPENKDSKKDETETTSLDPDKYKREVKSEITTMTLSDFLNNIKKLPKTNRGNTTTQTEQNFSIPQTGLTLQRPGHDIAIRYQIGFKQSIEKVMAIHLDDLTPICFGIVSQKEALLI